jgi:putative PEP-CTERM system histidine kinase
VMHDLKNLIAQQELVVQNAQRFKDNPEFIADAITTIESSVSRMTRLMSKISNHSILEHEEEADSVVLMDNVIDDALNKVSQRKPVPSFTGRGQGITVLANPDALTMAITHIVSNAQDACQETDDIHIELKKSDTDKFSICSISDTGTGMDSDFIENRLFKPFYSTKKTVGMGIGAYQSNEIVSNIGGHISVDSSPGVGSCFTLKLPLIPA